MIWALLLLAQSPPSVSVEAGWHGRAYADSWVSVIARVKTGERGFEGRLRARVQDAIGKGSVHEERLKLPQKTDRRFVVDFFAIGTETAVLVELVDFGGQVVASIPMPLTQQTHARRHLLVVGEPPVGSQSVPGEFDASVMRIGPDVLPFTLPPLLGTDGVVMARPVELANQQLETLRQWIDLGGRLVVSSGPHALELRSGPLRDLLPVEILGTEMVTRTEGEETQKFTLASVRVRPGASTFLAAEGRPLAVRWTRGRGEVVFLAHSLTDPTPVASGPVMWRAILGIGDREERDRSVPGTTATVLNRLGEGAVSVDVLGVLLGGMLALLYSIVVGPAEYVWLKRRRRFQRAWWRLLGWVALFSALFVMVSGRVSLTTARLWQVTIEDHADGVALVQSFAAFQANNARTFKVEGPPGSRLTTLPRLSTFALVADLPDPVVEEGRTLRLPMPARTLRSFAGVRAADPEVTARVVPESGAYEVENRSAHTLKKCLLVWQASVAEIGEVAAGSKRTIAPEELRAVSFEQWARRMLPARPGEPVFGWSPSLWEKLPPEEAALALSFYARLRDVLSPPAGREDWTPRRARQRMMDVSGLLARGEVVFVGRVESTESEFVIDAYAARDVKRLVRVVVKK